ncbi:hypothetical protein PMAYCL1PPCAC_22635, partial [Pristionchus mayeri]
GQAAMKNELERLYNLKVQESEDSVLTSEQQLGRLLGPGSVYLNLNPFEVLQISIDMDLEAAKEKYEKLSLLIHPDKNPDDRERADKSCDIVKKAVAIVEDPAQLAKAKDCYREARLARMLPEDDRGSIDWNEPSLKKALWVEVMLKFSEVAERVVARRRADEWKRERCEILKWVAKVLMGLFLGQSLSLFLFFSPHLSHSSLLVLLCEADLHVQGLHLRVRRVSAAAVAGDCSIRLHGVPSDGRRVLSPYRLSTPPRSASTSPARRHFSSRSSPGHPHYSSRRDSAHSSILHYDPQLSAILIPYPPLPS